MDKYQNVNFSAVYSVNGSRTSFSLRSMDDRTDVSTIATKYGGGGHRNASGIIVMNSIELPFKLVDNDKLFELLDNIYSIEYPGGIGGIVKINIDFN